MEMTERYKNNPKKLSERKLSENIPSGSSVFAMHHLKI